MTRPTQTATVPLPPPMPHGPGAPTPPLFASMSVRVQERWVKAQTTTWETIQTVSLGQPLPFKLAVQTSILGWARTASEVLLFRATCLPPRPGTSRSGLTTESDYGGHHGNREMMVHGCSTRACERRLCGGSIAVISAVRPHAACSSVLLGGTHARFSRIAVPWMSPVAPWN